MFWLHPETARVVIEDFWLPVKHCNYASVRITEIGLWQFIYYHPKHVLKKGVVCSTTGYIGTVSEKNSLPHLNP